MPPLRGAGNNSLFRRSAGCHKLRPETVTTCNTEAGGSAARWHAQMLLERRPALMLPDMPPPARLSWQLLPFDTRPPMVVWGTQFVLLVQQTKTVDQGRRVCPDHANSHSVCDYWSAYAKRPTASVGAGAGRLLLCLDHEA